MKFLFAIFLGLLNVVAFSQTTTFNNAYVDYRFNTAFSVLETADGYLILGRGVSEIVTRWVSLKVLKIDLQGNIQWIRAYGEEGQSYFAGYSGNLNRAHDGNYICAAMVQVTQSYYKGLLMKFDNYGDTLWTRSVGTTGKTEFYNSLVLEDGSIMVIGSTDRLTGSGGMNGYLAKFDPDGNMLWEKDYGGSRNELFLQFARTPDGGFICGGRTDTYSRGLADGYLVKTDSLGSFQWQKTFGTMGSDGAAGVALSSDGGYYIWGYYDSLISQNHYQMYPYLYKLDLNGEVVWEKHFPTLYPSYKTIQQVRERDGYVYACGSYADRNYELFGWFFKMSPTGSVEWERQYSYGSIDRSGWFEGFAHTSDAGFVCVGSVSRDDTLPAFHQSMWAVKVDSNGCLYPTTACVTGITEPQTLAATLYPNPAGNTLTIELPGGGEGRLTLYNLLGQEVFDTATHGRQTTVGLSLPPGVYLYRITQGTQHANGKLLVE